MRKCRRKRNVENKNKEVKGKNCEVEEIKIPKCSRKSHVETVNGETKVSSSEEEYIVIRKCRKIRKRKDGHPHRNNKKLINNQQIPKRIFV